ncbi:MAG: hypothetical protein QOI80_477, partial [Solirubrobacteraceae bacterium]|nr:hypothetical protein [Solirubrobacteraceae bacterium]
ESPISTARLGRGAGVVTGSISPPPVADVTCGRTARTVTRSRGSELTVDASITVRGAYGRSVACQRPPVVARAMSWQPALKQPAEIRTVVPAGARPATVNGRPAFTRSPACGVVMVIVGVAGVETGVAVIRAAGLAGVSVE